MSKPVIAIDIDDVIADSTTALMHRVNEKLGLGLTIEHYRTPADYWGYYEHVWQTNGIDTNEYSHANMSAEMAIDQSHVPLLPGASFAINKLAEKYDIHLITARFIEWEDATHRWLAEKFGVEIKGVYFTANDKGNAELTKGEICKKIGAKWLVDDNVEHCMSAKAAGVVPILFGEYGWHHKAPNDILKCRDWQAVLEYFSERG